MTDQGKGLALAGLALLGTLPIGVAQAFQVRSGDWTTSLDTTLSYGVSYRMEDQDNKLIARALAGSPRLLLADEPTGNLDSKSAAEVFELFRKFNREFGCAVLLVTHDPRLSEQCDRTVSLLDGRIESDTVHDPRA